MTSSASNAAPPDQFGVYECEVTLKFRMIEDHGVMGDPDQLLEVLVDAFSYGSDGFVEALGSDVSVQSLDEVQASPPMRRQLIRLRNRLT